MRGSSGLPRHALSMLCGVALAGAGCAVFSDDTLQQDVSQLRRDVNSLMVASNRARGDAQTPGQSERRYTEQLAESARQTAALSARLDSLGTELNRLSVRLDGLSQRVEGLTRQSQSPPRMGAVPGPVAPPPSVAAPPPARPPVSGPAVSGENARASAAPPAGAATSAGTPQESYQAAYLDFSRGRYPIAIGAFRDFVRRFPDSPLADSAQYGIGESYFSMARASAAAGQTEKSKQELEQSVQEFRRVLANYPRGSKVPTALYKEALALTELKQTALAQSRLQYLLDHFPQSEEASLAKERLATLKP